MNSEEKKRARGGNRVGAAPEGQNTASTKTRAQTSKKRVVDIKTLEKLFLTVPKTEWTRVWRRVQTGENEDKKALFIKYLAEPETVDAGVTFFWDDTPSEDEDAAVDDILNIKDPNVAPPAILDTAPPPKKEWTDVVLPTLSGKYHTEWLQFVVDNMFLCNATVPASNSILTVSEHLLRWFSLMAANPSMWEEEYPDAMRQSTGAVEQRDAFDTLKKADRKKASSGASAAEAIFRRQRFDQRLQRNAELTKNLTGDAYNNFVNKRTAVSKVMNLLKPVFRIPPKLLKAALFLLVDRIKSINERPFSYDETITLFEKNDDAMAERRSLRIVEKMEEKQPLKLEYPSSSSNLPLTDVKEDIVDKNASSSTDKVKEEPMKRADRRASSSTDKATPMKRAAKNASSPTDKVKDEPMKRAAKNASSPTDKATPMKRAAKNASSPTDKAEPMKRAAKNASSPTDKVKDEPMKRRKL